MAIDLNREAEAVRANGARVQGEGWLSDECAPSQVAAYVAASERVETFTPSEVVDIVKQGLDVDVAAGNDDAVRDLARRAAEARAGVASAERGGRCKVRCVFRSQPNTDSGAELRAV